MDTRANNTPLYQMDNFLMHLPKNRWMLLPFVIKVRPPPNIRDIQSLSEIRSISDTNILELLVSNHLVQIYKGKNRNRYSISDISYSIASILCIVLLFDIVSLYSIDAILYSNFDPIRSYIARIYSNFDAILYSNFDAI